MAESMIETPIPASASAPEGCLKKSSLKKTKYGGDAKKDTVNEEPTENTSTDSGKENGEAEKTEEEAKPERPKMKARFGSVRVAWHRMTLGNANPGGTKGVPLTLGELDSAERYATVDNFSQKFHYDLNGEHVDHRHLDRMTESTRRVIALKHHTEDEIAELENEVVEVTSERKKQKKEAEMNTFLEMKKKEREAEAMKNKQKKVGGGGIFSCFGKS